MVGHETCSSAQLSIVGRLDKELCGRVKIKNVEDIPKNVLDMQHFVVDLQIFVVVVCIRWLTSKIVFGRKIFKFLWLFIKSCG